VKAFFLILACEVLLAAGSLNAQTPSPPVLKLAEHVEVAGDTIWLSDLLPAGGSTDLQVMSKSLDLGLAPQPGSLRLLTRQQISARLADRDGLLRQLELPAQITVQRKGWPIREDTVLTAVSNYLQTQGWKNNALSGTDWLRWSGAVAARNEDAVLQVTGAKPDIAPGTLEVRLRCVDRSLCSSFLAFVTFANPFPGAVVSPVSGRGLSSKQTPSSGKIRTRSGETQSPGLVERGASAQLKMEGGGMEISVSVICLERGSLGEQIRVRAARHRVLLAEVVGSNQLRASF